MEKNHENSTEWRDLPESCKVRDYKGIRMPVCCGGSGCQRCWLKYWETKGLRVSALSRPNRPSSTEPRMRKSFYSPQMVQAIREAKEFLKQRGITKNPLDRYKDPFRKD